MTPPTPQQLALLLDEELQDLAALWRKQAAHGVRPAFGVAHALEAECRRRGREHMAQLRPARVSASADEGRWWNRLWPQGVAANKKGLGMSAESLMLP